MLYATLLKWVPLATHITHTVAHSSSEKAVRRLSRRRLMAGLIWLQMLTGRYFGQRIKGHYDSNDDCAPTTPVASHAGVRFNNAALTARQPGGFGRSVLPWAARGFATSRRDRATSASATSAGG